MSEKKVYDITLDFAEIYGVNSEYTDNIGGEVYYPYDRYSKFPPNNFPENITPVQNDLPLPDNNIAENHYYHTYERYSTVLQKTFQENVAPVQESSTLPDSVKADHYFPYDRFPTVPPKSFKDDVQEQSTSKRADGCIPADHFYPFERYSKAPQNNFPENITPEEDITTAPIEDEDTEYNNKCSALALSILEDGDPDDFYPSDWDLNEMDKNPPTGPPRRISNRPTLKNLNPVFHRRDKSEDDNELSQTLLKQARKSGSLNLSGRGLATVPEKVYDINQSDKDAEVTLESLVAKEEDAWWNQVPLSNLDLSSNALTSLSPKIANLYSLTTLILHDNCLSSLPKEIGKLEKLTRVNLSRNQLVELPTEFYTLPNLRYLNLSHNNIEELHPDISDLHMLEILDVSNNQLTLLPNGIGFLVRLTQLLLSYNHIKELPEDLVNMRSLQKLDLLHNDLIQLPDDIGSLRKLQCLYLQHNDIVALPDFEGCEDLQELHVANNFISSLPTDLCSKLPHLKILDLRDNKIVKLPDEIALLQSLIRLDLSNNSITSLPCSLSTLAHLVSLQLEGNPIKSIRRDILQCGTARILKTLRDRFLSAEGNCSTSTSTTTLTSTAMGGDGLNMPSRPMPQGGFIGDETSVYPDKFKLRKTHCLTVTLQNLTEVPDYVFEVANDENANIVDFSKNRLTTLPPGLQIMRKCASELIFANNLICSIPPFISQFTRISLIDISCNSLEDLPKEFGVLNTLRELNISNNRFQQLPQCVYDLQNLEVLMARDNRIRRIDTSEQGLGALKRLATLNLRNNNIEQVPPTLGNLKNITTLDIVGNPFRQPRHQVLEKGTEAIMSYLRDRIPV